MEKEKHVVGVKHPDTHCEKVRHTADQLRAKGEVYGPIADFLLAVTGCAGTSMATAAEHPPFAKDPADQQQIPGGSETTNPPPDQPA